MTTNITAPNGATTPVTKTFTVSRSAVGDESAVLHLREGASPLAYPKVEFSTKPVNTGRMRGRGAAVTLVVPYGYNDANGNFVKIDQCAFTGKMSIPDDAPDAVRKDFAAFIPGVLTDAQVKDLAVLGYAK